MQLQLNVVVWMKTMKQTVVSYVQTAFVNRPLSSRDVRRPMGLQRTVSGCSMERVYWLYTNKHKDRQTDRETGKERKKRSRDESRLLTWWKDDNGELVFNRTETIDSGAVEKPGVRAVDVTYNKHAVLWSDAVALPANVDRVSGLEPVNVRWRVRRDGTPKT